MTTTEKCPTCQCDPTTYGDRHQCEHTEATCFEHANSALYLEQSNPNQPTPAKYCARCGYAPCLFALAQNPERGDDRLDLCRQVMAQPTTPANAASDLLTELQISHPNLTRSDIRTLLRQYL